MKLEQTGYLVPVVGGCMKTVQRELDDDGQELFCPYCIV